MPLSGAPPQGPHRRMRAWRRGRVSGRSRRELPRLAGVLFALLTFFSASLPMKPIRVILLRYIRFSVSALLSRATRKRVGAAPKTRSCFSGGTGHRGSQNRNGCRRQSRSFAGAGRRKSAEAVPGLRARQETCLKWVAVMMVAAAEEERTQKTSTRRLHPLEHSTAWLRGDRHGATRET